MPQICKLLGYLIFFWSHETGEPVHVHVCKGKPVKDATKIWIEDEPRIEHNKSKIPQKDLNRILQWLSANKNFVINKWNEHFEQ